MHGIKHLIGESGIYTSVLFFLINLDDQRSTVLTFLADIDLPDIPAYDLIDIRRAADRALKALQQIYLDTSPLINWHEEARDGPRGVSAGPLP
jgi:hypothetical protein